MLNEQYLYSTDDGMKLDQLPMHLEDVVAAIPARQQLIQAAASRLQIFWDQWYRRPIEQYVACDFEYVAAGIDFILREGLNEGNNFCEWGCGFGVVTGMAALAGMAAVGIEAEAFLVEEARRLLSSQGISAEIWQGNFLPRGAQRLADPQSNHASLFHDVPSAYEQNDMELDDFALLFAYPWPGEEHYLREVFARYARRNALLLMFRGPYQMELYRKTG